MLKRLCFLVLLVGALACSKTEEPKLAVEPETLPEKIDFFIEQDRYEDALAALEQEEVSEEILLLKEKAHLNYGIFTVYQADPSTMRENANKALRQFIAVLDINRDNQKAISEIENIMSIYSTFPNRSPEEDVIEDLKRLGFNY